MAHFTPQDILFVTILQRGTARGATRLTGVSSLGEVVNAVRAVDPGLSGMTVLDVRNATGGWSARQPVFIR